MRPVLMTSGALIFGMLPMVLTESIGAEFRAPMAAITIGGLMTSTLLTLIVVPVVYSVVDAGTVWLRGSFARLRAVVGERVPVKP
jgi:HAE1 family hydrophobic/amphiphilic exporter-1